VVPPGAAHPAKTSVPATIILPVFVAFITYLRNGFTKVAPNSSTKGFAPDDRSRRRVFQPKPPIWMS
jgi:hypothetical protein